MKLTRLEQMVALERFKRWPKGAGRELLKLPAEERDIVIEAVALLDAEPAEGWPRR
jgi:hypothetical protein